MTVLIGTGKNATYPKGVDFDVPDHQSELIAQLLKDGLADEPKRDVEKRIVEVANGVVRGDPLVHPADAEVASKIEKGKASAHDIVHAADAKTTPGSSELKPEEAQERVPVAEAIGDPKDVVGGAVDRG